MRHWIRSSPLLSYFLLAYGFTWAIGIPLLLSARGIIDFHLPEALEALAAFGPFAAALVVLAALQGREGVKQLLRGLLRWRVAPPWFFFAVASPLLVLLIAVYTQDQIERLAQGDFLTELAIRGGLFELIVIGGILQGFGEEPGWRGFALPVLRGRFGPLLATLALFPVWLLWHLPFFLSRPELTLGSWLGFSIGIFSAAVWCTAIYDATRSLLMVALWHALINITRGIALAVSTAAFLAFGQVVLGVALLIILVWLYQRPGRYVS